MIQSLSAPARYARVRRIQNGARVAPQSPSFRAAQQQQRQASRSALLLPDFRSAAEDWLLDGAARLSKKTVTDRRGLVAKLLWWLERENCRQVGRSELARFFAYLPVSHEDPDGRWGNAGDDASGSGRPAAIRQKARAGKPLSPVSCGNYFRWLRTLFLYLVEVGTLDESPMRTLRPAVHRDNQIHPFSREQVTALLSAARDTEYPTRDTAIFLFLLDTGARASELCGMKAEDLNARERSVRVTGKGAKERTLYLSPLTLRALLEYQRDLGNGESPYLFGSQRGDALTPNALNKLVHRLGAAAGVTGVRCSPHTCRHTFAVEYLRGGGDPFSLQMIMGHTDLAQTRRYIAFAGADIKKNHGMFSPVAAMKLSSSRKRS